ncbi:hypothetical protein J6590_076956 [Homalodisca vitripennis]|nr:hypothetical protein J6590_076956 [Homalodisca vitripennis]
MPLFVTPCQRLFSAHSGGRSNDTKALLPLYCSCRYFVVTVSRQRLEAQLFTLPLFVTPCQRLFSVHRGGRSNDTKALLPLYCSCRYSFTEEEEVMIQKPCYCCIVADVTVSRQRPEAQLFTLPLFVTPCQRLFSVHRGAFTEEEEVMIQKPCYCCIVADVTVSGQRPEAQLFTLPLFVTPCQRLFSVHSGAFTEEEEVMIQKPCYCCIVADVTVSRQRPEAQLFTLPLFVTPCQRLFSVHSGGRSNDTKPCYRCIVADVTVSRQRPEAQLFTLPLFVTPCQRLFSVTVEVEVMIQKPCYRCIVADVTVSRQRPEAQLFTLPLFVTPCQRLFSVHSGAFTVEVEVMIQKPCYRCIVADVTVSRQRPEAQLFTLPLFVTPCQRLFSVHRGAFTEEVEVMIQKPCYRFTVSCRYCIPTTTRSTIVHITSVCDTLPETVQRSQRRDCSAFTEEEEVMIQKPCYCCIVADVTVSRQRPEAQLFTLPLFVTPCQCLFSVHSGGRSNDTKALLSLYC